MTKPDHRSPASGEGSGRAPIGKLILLGFLAGGGFGFLITLLYIIFR